MRDSNFKIIGDKTAYLGGTIGYLETSDLFEWCQQVLDSGDIGFILIIDSSGGFADPLVLLDLLCAPIHTHIMGKAESFAAVIALSGSMKTCDPDATFMLHQPRLSTQDIDGHRTEFLHSHRLRLAALIASILPASIKEDIMYAITHNEDCYFNVEYLYEQGILDDIRRYDIKKLGISPDHVGWFSKKYKLGAK